MLFYGTLVLTYNLYYVTNIPMGYDNNSSYSHLNRFTYTINEIIQIKM